MPNHGIRQLFAALSNDLAACLIPSHTKTAVKANVPSRPPIPTKVSLNNANTKQAVDAAAAYSQGGPSVRSSDMSA